MWDSVSSVAFSFFPRRCREVVPLPGSLKGSEIWPRLFRNSSNELRGMALLPLLSLPLRRIKESGSYR